jgi:hypothetical protein
VFRRDKTFKDAMVPAIKDMMPEDTVLDAGLAGVSEKA